MQLAKETGLTREGLYKALSKDGNPSLGTVLKVLKALGLKFTPRVVGKARMVQSTCDSVDLPSVQLLRSPATAVIGRFSRDGLPGRWRR